MNTNLAAGIDRLKLVQLIMGYGATQAVACVAKLGIADHLADGPRTVSDLAVATGSSPAHLGRLMRVLCRVGLFSESGAGFHLTPISRHLCKDAVDSLLPLAKLHGDEMYSAFSKLTDSVLTGVSAWESSVGKTVWEYFDEHPDRGALFDETMRLNHAADVQGMVQAYDFSTVRTVADVGGGEGSLLRAILDCHASIQGVLIDLPEVISRASGSVAWRDLAPRCSFVPGNFFDDLPAGIDLYVLRHVLHDWNDQHCVRLLKRCRDSMQASSRLLVIETLVDKNTQFGPAAWSDLGMMVLGGEERTANAYQQLLEAAGLTVTNVTPCARVTLIEARRR